MQMVTQLPSKEAQEALKHLEAAWAYYTPQPHLAYSENSRIDEKSTSPFVPYYTAA